MSVTVRTPAAIKVRIDSTPKVKTVSSSTTSTSIKSASDLSTAGANTGDVIVYDANTQGFRTAPLGTVTPVGGSLIPKQGNVYDLGTPEIRFKSLYLTGQTIDMDGAIVKADPQTGAIAFLPRPSEEFPNPQGIILTPKGGFAPFTSVDGEIPPSNQIVTLVAGSNTYTEVTKVDAGFF